MSTRQISPHFHRDEFRCPCGCGGDTADAELVEVLEIVRERFDTFVTVTSGYRCEAYNRKIGGAATSFHMKGQAADIQVDNVRPAEVAEWLGVLYPERYGVIVYPGHVHVDVRDTPYRGTAEYA